MLLTKANRKYAADRIQTSAASWPCKYQRNNSKEKPSEFHSVIPMMPMMRLHKLSIAGVRGRRRTLFCEHCGGCLATQKRWLNTQQNQGKNEESKENRKINAHPKAVMFAGVCVCVCCCVSGRTLESMLWHSSSKHFCTTHTSTQPPPTAHRLQKRIHQG